MKPPVILGDEALGKGRLLNSELLDAPGSKTELVLRKIF